MIRSFLVLLLLAGLLSSCSTGFKKSDGKGFGYKIKEFEQGRYFTHGAWYHGNKYTKIKDSDVYSRMAAVKYCESQNKFAVIANQTRNHTRVYRNSKLGVTSNGGLYNYETTNVFPSHITFFRCENEVYQDMQGVSFKKLPANLIKDYVSDFGSALQVIEINNPQKGPLKIDDVIIAVNGQRTKDSLDFYVAMDQSQGNTAPMKVIRNKKITEFRVPIGETSKFHRMKMAEVINEFCFRENNGGATKRLQSHYQECLKEHNHKDYLDAT